ncbi:MAG: DJ-1/PfpI family protein [Candidatus Omnitrophota bacterium]|jgi:protease I
MLDIRKTGILFLAIFGVFNCYAYGAEIKMKNVLMVIAEDHFRDEEYFQPKNALEIKGINVLTASASLNTATGSLGGKVAPDLLISAADMKDYDALVLIGGGGAEQYYDDPVVHNLIRQAENRQKIIAAICIAPVILARAGALKGKKATVWHSEAGEINNAGGKYTGSKVEKDGNIITANGPDAVLGFIDELLKLLLN